MYKAVTPLASLLLSLLFLVSSANAAENSLKQVQQQLDDFKQSELAMFAPQTIDRANALVGAAMLAKDQLKREESKSAVVLATAKLAEAKQTATAFKRRFNDLILLRDDAKSIAEIVASPGQSSGYISPTQILKPARDALMQAISSHEQGQLNQTQAYADKAQKLFTQIISDAIPQLTEITASVVGKAANSGAKQYAPKIYQRSKKKLAELRNFMDGLSQVMPSRPVDGLYLAREAKHMSEQVKLWRKKTGSHEQIVLAQRSLKLKLANALHISSATNPMLTEIEGKDLLAALEKANRDLADERTAHKQTIALLKKQAAEELQRQLSLQTESMTLTQQQRMSTIKDAYRAKLERGQAQLEKETFETKRQAKLHKLFKKNEASVLVNLDGSLLIRLSGLQFAPGRSKVDAKYYDMLERLKQAMAIYQDRSLSIEGHTDNLGEVKPNQQLSLKRAEAVRDFLISSGADSSRLKALGYGEVRPIASNDFPQGRAMNRRIDVVIQTGK
ncbi:OmpA family protein [Mariprofundus sp. EBB-1]|uniref:OmpA family protein n=1 Tax=Mariprofundus sp. EBB-1 TaxID=2650971 RepID=UPI000EF237AF|nr:OmpA family protein [Mariprofundus sp. EBB-1]RLL54304.1 OmpA family protein [Mariprofundus sp. EBB-1]